MKFTVKIWILISFVIFSFLSLFVAVNPVGLTFLQEGVLISSIEMGSSLYESGLREGMVITNINGQSVKDIGDYQELTSSYYELGENETVRTEIYTRDLEIVGLYGLDFVYNINVEEMPSTKLETGLDLQGGARAFIKVDGDVSSSDLNDVIAVLEERLNVYGLSDINMYQVEGVDGESLIGIEIAGSSPEQLEELIEEQGHFEAKIGNETVFVGGNEDITHVARTGEKSIVYNCRDIQDGTVCDFQFIISLSVAAADRFANITKDLISTDDYLSENITFYIDGVETSALRISSDLKGSPQTSISITGAETGIDQKEAYDNTKSEMKKLQTILITGSLPYDLEIVKIDRISPNLGDEFSHQIVLAGLFAILSVTLLTFLRYKKIKVSLAIILTSFSEVLIILGIASLINWNLDLPSVAGIIAAIGTGIDSQIIILDESRVKGESLKQQIKKALFIITTAFATTLVALLPLTGALGWLGVGAASAGLLKGFAVTTIIGITVGVLISRPAFAEIVKQLQEE